MTELMRLYLEIRKKNPGLSTELVRQQAMIFYFRKNLPISLNTEDKSYLDNLASSVGISGELTYVAPPVAPITPEPEVNLSTNEYVVDEYIDDYFE